MEINKVLFTNDCKKVPQPVGFETRKWLFQNSSLNGTSFKTVTFVPKIRIFWVHKTVYFIGDIPNVPLPSKENYTEIYYDATKTRSK